MRLESQKEAIKLAEKRVYEVMYIADPETSDEIIKEMNEVVEKIVTDENGEVVNIDDMGLREMAYAIQKNNTGHYVLFENEGSGREIAEIERRFRVNDFVMRYITVRVDQDRKTAAKRTAKREKRKNRIKNLNQAETESNIQDNQ
jgi:small subunit ribosomal protein S6